MNFQNPSLFWTLLVIPVVWGWIMFQSSRRQQMIRAMIAPRLRENLVPSSPPGRLFVWIFYSLAFAALVTTAARPLGKNLTQTIKVNSRSILLLVDVSKSMLAPDVPPSRLARAKLIGLDILDEFPNDRFGIIAFAGTSYLLAPLTSDHQALRETLEQTDVEVIPRGGSNLALPLELALETFQKNGPGKHGIVLLSDGAELEGEALQIADRAKSQNVSILSIGIGTKLGARIPDPYETGEYILDENGDPVVAKLEDAILKDLSSRSGGTYVHAGQSGIAASALRQAISKLDETMSEDTTISRREELYQWPLSFAVLFLAFGAMLEKIGLKIAARRETKPALASASTTMKRTMPISCWPLWIGILSGFALGNGMNAHAYDPLTAIEQGRHAAALKQYQELAADAKTDKQRSQAHYGAGIAAYFAGNYPIALEEFSHSLIMAPDHTRALARLGLGNTHFILGYQEGQEIIEAFGIGQDIQLQSFDQDSNRQNTSNEEFKRFLESFKFTIRPEEPVRQDAFGQLPRKLNAQQLRQGLQLIENKIDRSIAILSEGIPHLQAASEFLGDEAEARKNHLRAEQLKRDLEELKKQLRQEVDEQDPPPPPPQNQSGESQENENDEGEEGEDGEPSDSQDPSSQGQQPGDPSQNPSDTNENSEDASDADSQGQSPSQQRNQSQGGENDSPPEGSQAPEGKLEAQRRGENQKPSGQEPHQNGDQQRDDQTGYTPEEARNKLQQFSDELPMTLGQPQRPRQRRPFKDW